jgi:hypothetical protein
MNRDDSEHATRGAEGERSGMQKDQVVEMSDDNGDDAIASSVRLWVLS